MGAVAAVSYKEKGWEKQLAEKAGRPPALIIDSAGGPDFAALVNGVAAGGRIVSYGATRGPVEKLEMTRVFFKQIDVLGSTMGNDEEFRAMLRLAARERVRPVVDHVFALSQAAEADRRLAQSEQMGKIVLNCRA
jgi:zinc-binding alcohol dehydrogenase/oxidoreductase